MAAASRSRNFMVVLPLVCRDHRFEIVRRSLHVLSDGAARVRALVVAPALRIIYIYIFFFQPPDSILN